MISRRHDIFIDRYHLGMSSEEGENKILFQGFTFSDSFFVLRESLKPFIFGIQGNPRYPFSGIRQGQSDERHNGTHQGSGINYGRDQYEKNDRGIKVLYAYPST